ncbi:cysteine dioxygenase [Paenibacillus sp. UNC451MF]|uniref:cysteine dioxygenase n=1 Tax=Paenibacillus sp. UNC451MF TaxID=1449063 RepID=UPI0004910857|nr:cysteine dioxygenase family protein [Paenibacillus sp. UNC451MF]
MKLLESVKQVFQHVVAPSGHELRRAIEQLKLEPQEVASYVTEPATLPYGRRVLFQSEHVEVILIHLPAGHETYIHDHGESIGCAFVLEGELTNKQYWLDKEGYAYECGEAVLGPSQFLFAPKGQIHQMCNYGKQRVVTLHAYTPAMKDTKVYYPYEQVLDYVI